MSELLDKALDKTNEHAVAALVETKDEVLNKLREKINNLGVNKSTLTIIIKFVMEAVEDTPLKGAKQKEYAIKLIMALVEENAKGDDKEFIRIAIDSGSVGDTIDLIASAAKGELNINKVVQAATRSCIPALIECCFSENK